MAVTVKRIVYIVLFIVLGVLLQFLVHVALEYTYLKLLFRNFELYGFGLSWDTWFTIHHVSSIVLFFLGVAFGFWQGMYWWQRLYDTAGVKRPWSKLKQ